MPDRPPEIVTAEEREDQHPLVKQTYIGREVKVYAIHDYEIKTLSYMNVLSHFFFSLGTGLLGLGLAIILNASFQGELTPAGVVLMKFGAPICFVLAVILFGAGWYTIFQRKKELRRIMEATIDD